MPTQAVQNASFAELFGQHTRFIIPYFQRGYAWDRKQWDQLVLDIDEQVIDELERGVNIDNVDHFFGPIVVLERPSNQEGETECVVIDGQQRITTIYLLLSLIRRQLHDMRHLAPEADRYIATLGGLLENPCKDGDDYSRLKVFSTKGDRLPTYRIVFGDDNFPKSPLTMTDLEVYRPGYNLIEALESYVQTKYKFRWKDVTKLWRYAQALLHCLKVVWIPLDPQKDDPQAIFESLNDRGMPLSACELICSYLFRPLEGADDFEQLHNASWLGSIKALGSTEKFEEYLRHLFSINESAAVGKQRKVYVHFKKRHANITASTARAALDTIVRFLPNYLYASNPLDNPHPKESLRKILVDIHLTRMDSCLPFVLAVLDSLESESLSLDQGQAMLAEVLTLLVRRKLSELPTSAYDEIFPGLLPKLTGSDDWVQTFHAILKHKSLWISDSDFIDVLIKKPLYRQRDIPFSRMVLMEIDKRLHEGTSRFDYSSATVIEHVMPESLDGAWRKLLGADATHELRETLVHTLGNLCLLSESSENPLSTALIDDKRTRYDASSALAVDLKNSTGPWNLDAIRDRSRRLAQVALQVYPWMPHPKS